MGSIPARLLTAACSTLRHVTGITTALCTTMSFILMKSAARLTGSISFSALRHSRSNSALRQREMLRPFHPFSFVGISHEANWAMKSWGSRPVNTV